MYVEQNYNNSVYAILLWCFMYCIIMWLEILFVYRITTSIKAANITEFINITISNLININGRSDWFLHCV